jgi:DHA1 family inner membrane transport protein
MSKEKILLLTLAIIQFTSVMDFMIMMPLGPQLMRIFDITPQQFSILVSSYTLSAGVFVFVAAFFIDKFDRKTILLAVYVGFTLGTLACALAPTYSFLLMARILTGVFGGILGALVLAVVGDAIPLERRAAAMGTVMTAFSFASVIGVPVGLHLATDYDWHMPFISLAVMGGLVTVMIYRVIPSMTMHLQKEKSNSNPFQFLINIGKDNNQLKALALMVFMMLGQFSYISLLSPYMVSNVGFSEHELKYIYFLGGAITLVTSPICGRLADKYGRAKIFTIFSILCLVPLFLLTNLPKTEIYIVLIITTFNFVFITGRMIPGSTMITATVLPQNRGSFMSINSCVQHIGSGMAALIAGMIVTKNANGQIENYEYVGYIAMASVVISLYLANNIKAIDTGTPVKPELVAEPQV